MSLLKQLYTIVKNPEYMPAYWRTLGREFSFFDFDYRFLSGYSFPPKSICFILTKQCNLKCVMCDIGQRNAHLSSGETFPLAQSIEKGGTAMNLDDWKNLVNDIAEKRWKPLLLLTGTEPFIYLHVLELVEHIVANALRLHITTNGTLLSSFADRLVDLCTKPDSISITISLDGIGEVHDTIRGVSGTFDKAIAGLEAVAERKRECGKHWPEITINYTISNFNDQHLREFVQWINERDFDLKGITFSHLWFKDEAIVVRHNQHYGEMCTVQQENLTGLDIAAINMENVHSQLQTIRETSGHFPFSILEQPRLTLDEAKKYYSRPTEMVFYSRCLAPWRNVSINPQGEVIISPLCFDYTLGNVKKNSFSRIWNDTSFKKFRKMLKRVGIFPACTRCCMLFDSKPKYYKIRDLF